MTPTGDWFALNGRAEAIGCGARGQNRDAVRALLDCLARRLPIHASLDGVRAAEGAGPWLYCQSSGSGGRVKTIRRSQSSWIASFLVNRDTYGLGAADRYAVLGQLGHSLALYASVEALHLGAGLEVLASDGPRRQLDALARGVSVIYATPTQLQRLLGAAGAPLPGVAHVFCGGGRLDPASRAALGELFPAAMIREFYGASETSFIAIADGATPPGSVGRAYPGVELDLTDCAEIRVRSPYLAAGYAEPDLKLALQDGWLATGDVGALDAAGHLFLRGRLGRMVTVADRNLFLEDVEAAMRAAGAGLCAALALPDPLRGHSLLAVVEGAPDDALAARLRRHCRATLGDHAAPRRVVFLERLPLLASDKPDLAGLAARFAAP
ncbi:AMP-binding protein [Paracoccus limosus]|uniref:AMP-binding protein n=1 Tax=Paracoccus limosus TaxID=913252 RepID=UPI0031B62073